VDPVYDARLPTYRLHFNQTKAELEPDQKTTGLPLGVLRLREDIARNLASLSDNPCPAKWIFKFPIT